MYLMCCFTTQEERFLIVIKVEAQENFHNLPLKEHK